MSILLIRVSHAALASAALLLSPLPVATQVPHQPEEVEEVEVVEEVEEVEEVAQAERAVQAQQAVREALVLGGQMQFSAAVDQLNSARLACALVTDAPSCLNLVTYSLGYVHQIEATHEPGDRPALLQRAARYYQEVVDADPGYQDAVYNLSLVLRELGPQEWQERYYRSAPELDPQRRPQHLILLGDYYAAQDRWRQAIVAYETALEDDPGNRAAAAALVEIADEAPREWMSRLLEHSAEWERALPDVASEAYETMLRRMSSGTEELTERAFLRLAVLTDGRVRLDPSDAGPASALAAAANELEAFLHGAWQPLSNDSWWLQSETRRRALAEASLRAGTRWVAQGRPDRAQQCWSAADSYAVSSWPEALDLKRELALLYFRHDDLDPTGDRFRELEQEIFLEKGDILRAADHAAAQRYHTALGLIYAERGEWAGPPARNAVDQLTWALEKGEVVDEETGGHRPLPEIRTLLAEGLEETGNSGGARRLHLQASLGYVDTDALVEATDALQRAGETPQAAPLQELIAARERLERLGADSAAALEDICESRAIAVATRAAADAGGDEFAGRQRFRFLADCARWLPAGRATEYQAEAFELVVQQRLPLVGTADLRRFKRARATLVEAAGLPGTARGLRYIAAEGRPRGIAVSLPGESRPAYLPVPEEEALAGRVVRLLAPGTDRLRIRLNGGVVQVDSAQAEQISPALMAELSRLEGVNAVRVGAARGGGGDSP